MPSRSEGTAGAATAEAVSRLRCELERLPTERRLDELTTLGEGLEFVVLRARSASGPVAVRVPRQRLISNDNDPFLDTRDLLRQEVALLEYVRDRGLPAPTVAFLHEGEVCDFLVTELMAGDGSEPGGFAMGRLAAALHRLSPPAMALAADPRRAIASTLAERITRRAQVVETRAGATLGLPDEDELRRLLDWSAAEPRLLHMDFRPANLLTRRGRIAAIVDWSNALVADAALELARIAESGYLEADFLAGYRDADPLGRVPEAVRLLYRLDAAVMLAVVFVSEAPDPGRAAAQVARVRSLARELSRTLGRCERRV